MAPRPFPTSEREIDKWCHDSGFPRVEGRRRFVSIVTLRCLGADSILGDGLAFKGGNALRFGYDSPRSTLDLDFTVDGDGILDDADWLRKRVNHALRQVEQRYTIRANCQRVRRNPPAPRATRPTYEIKIGYQFPGDRYYAHFGSKPVSTTILLEVSFNDAVCETRGLKLSDDDWAEVRTCTLEDIIAEKLRAMLQQPLRNRLRPQDVYDVAHYWLKPNAQLDPLKITRLFIRKCQKRDIEPRKSAFDEEVRAHAATEYDASIRRQTGERFIPFEDAWNAVLRLVAALHIPD